jgi:hypothetical protein
LPGLAGYFLDWRQEILKHRASAEVDFGADPHAGNEAQRHALALRLISASDPIAS